MTDRVESRVLSWRGERMYTDEKNDSHTTIKLKVINSRLKHSFFVQKKKEKRENYLIYIQLVEFKSYLTLEGWGSPTSSLLCILVFFLACALHVYYSTNISFLILDEF